MSDQTQRHEIANRRVVYEAAGLEAVTMRRDVEYRATDAGPLTMDIYYPPHSRNGSRIPAVVFVSGYPDPGMQRALGCRFKEMGSTISWAQLAAVSGLVAITYTNREPAADVEAVLQHVRENAGSLQIDENRIGVWACSGHVPLTLSILIQERRESLRCAVLCYGFMFDAEGSTIVADAARMFGFVNPCAGRSVDDLPQDLPLFIVRAGQDQTPHINETIDRFLVKALIRNLPVTFVNHAAAPHAFDLLDDSETSRELIRQILAFMRFHLSAQVRSA